MINAEIKKQLGQWGLAMSPLLAIANTGVITAKNINFNLPKPPSQGELVNTSPELVNTSQVELVNTSPVEVVTTSNH